MRTLFALLLLPFLAACASVRGGPARPAWMDVEPVIPTNVTAITCTDPLVVACRDSIVFAKMASIDRSFTSYRQSLITGNSDKQFGVDVATLALSTAAAATGGAAFKSAAAAAIAVLTGANASFDKAYLYERLIVPLISQMEKDRARIKLEIIAKLASPAYTIAEADADLEEYFQAGTIPGAVVAMSEESAASARDAKQQVRAQLRVLRGVRPATVRRRPVAPTVPK